MGPTPGNGLESSRGQGKSLQGLASSMGREGWVPPGGWGGCGGGCTRPPPSRQTKEPSSSSHFRRSQQETERLPENQTESGLCSGLQLLHGSWTLCGCCGQLSGATGLRGQRVGLSACPCTLHQQLGLASWVKTGAVFLECTHSPGVQTPAAAQRPAPHALGSLMPWSPRVPFHGTRASPTSVPWRFPLPPQDRLLPL